jgi:pyruvate/2-oxoglutarate dehydrogenase complex dihydrolipoamide dehydrogenase (E3) component
MFIKQYDVIIVGAGQAGNPFANALAKAGKKVALVEREHVGGTCLNEGCTPTKTMVASARVAYLARRAADYGVRSGLVTVDMVKVRQRKREIVSSFVGGSERRLAASGVDLIRGEARFSAQQTPGLHVMDVRLGDGSTLQIASPKVVLNTGARPARPDLPGLLGDGVKAGVPFLDSTSIMELDQVPEHLLVLGGGYVGLEFGQMFRRFGSQVTIVQRGPQLLGREDDDVAEAVAEIMRQDGIEVLLDTAALSVEGVANGSICLKVRTPEGERILSGSHLLVATGRVPNTERLNLVAAGVTTDPRGFIQVNDRLETAVPGIYAAGDVKGGPAFTHISYDDFRILRASLLPGRPDDAAHRTTSGRMVPYVVYIDPQLGRVGLSEGEARRQGREIRVAKMPMDYISRTLEVDEARGFMKAVVDAASGQVLGFTCLGLEGGEIMAMVQIAMLGGLPYTALSQAIFSHPSLAESLNSLFAQLE